MLLFQEIRQFFTQGNSRTLKAKKNIFISLIVKGISILTTLLIVPVTINYVNPTQYGIWLTLSSILGWLSFFDMGFTHGFRNKFAEARALGNYQLAISYVSTTYVILTIIFGILWIICLLVNQYLNWSEILNIDAIYNTELAQVFIVITGFFCMQMVFSVITTLITADQSPALASVINCLGQVLSLIVVFLLTQTTKGTLLSLAWSISSVPTFILLLATLFFFHTKYKEFRPRFSYVNFKYIKNIIGLGGNFFIIQITMIFLFQCTNIILSNIKGPESVTIYNISYKYFNVFNMIMATVLTPFWSAFTEAYTKADYDWMKGIYKQLKKIWWGVAFLILLFLLISPWVLRLWIGDSVQIPMQILCAMSLYILFLSRCGIAVTLLNGMSKTRIQLYANIVFSIMTVPLLFLVLSYFELEFGIAVLILAPLIQTFLYENQIKRVLLNKATGIWNK